MGRRLKKSMQRAITSHSKRMAALGVDISKPPELRGAVEHIGRPPERVASSLPPTSDVIPGTNHRMDRLDALALSRESDGTREEMLRKAARTSPVYNKGGYQYVSDNADMANGRRVTG